jgi:sterol desaturase/sphingolipid hydroxylase (fatty acid hydroxylase superfamily)
VDALLGFLLLDYGLWWWHRLNHEWPFLWRFHNVHHVDPDMDVSTALRFHFGELVLANGFRALHVLALGVSPAAVLVLGCSLFHHSNWRLKENLEEALNRAVVTPRMHTIHHSVILRQTNSNYGTIFPWWDDLHGTRVKGIPPGAVTIGVAGWRSRAELTFWRSFLMPFGRQRARE